MKKVFVSLPETEDVQHFVETVTALEGDFELISDKYILDARSLMGIFSLDRTKPVQLKIYKDTKENFKSLQKFIVEDVGA